MILINGDSITYGQGLLPGEKSWPDLLFKNFINIAEPGSSNDSIYRRTIEMIMLSKNLDTVVVGWTYLGRTELGDKFSKAKTLLPAQGTRLIDKELATNWLGDYWLLKRFLMNLYTLRLLLIQQNIKFYCVNFGNDTAEMFSKIENYKEFKQLFNLQVWADKEIHKEFVLINRLNNLCKNNWLIDPSIDGKSAYSNTETVSKTDFHPNQQGHYKIADFIKLNSNILL